MSDSAQAIRMTPSGDPQLTGTKGNRAYPKRVPSSLTPETKRAAVLEFRAGRSAHQIGWDKSVSAIVVLELVIRDLTDQVRQLRRAA